MCIKFHRNRMIFHGYSDSTIFKMAVVLNFRGPIMGSLKSPCKTSYRSSIEMIALSCLVFEKKSVLSTHFGDGLTADKQMDSIDAWKSCGERRLKKKLIAERSGDASYRWKRCRVARGHYKFLLVFHCNLFYHFGDIQRRIMVCPWKFGLEVIYGQW